MDAEAQVEVEPGEEGDGLADEHLLVAMESGEAVGNEDDEEDLDPALHSAWMSLCDSDCDDEEGQNSSAPKHLPGGRVKAFKDRPEFIQLESEGLTDRPSGCSIGVHPGARQWRAYAEESTFFGRSWGANRTPRQALLRVLQLMLESYCAKHKHDGLARKQLKRVGNAREAEPPHAD